MAPRGSVLIGSIESWRIVSDVALAVKLDIRYAAFKNLAVTDRPFRICWFVPPAVHAAATAAGVVAGDWLDATRTTSSDAQFDELAAGQCDAAITAMDNVFAWQRRPGGASLRVVAQVERTTPLTLVARPGVDALAGLRGARILVDAPANGFVVALLAMLDSVGVHVADVVLDAAGGVAERQQALADGRGDATLLGPPFDAMAVEAGMIALTTVQDHEPAYPGQALVVRIDDPAAMARAGRWLAAVHSVLGTDPTLPTSLRPDRDGVDVLLRHRRQLGLPGADDSYDTLVDASLLDGLEG
jgi:ABC-type nitrate/sulfonate/bicarbonate transport system substrate-binding protein